MSNLAWVTLLGLYSVLIIGGIHYYEGKIKDLKGTVYDYQRAYKISKNNDHYTYLQIDNADLRNKVVILSQENELLQYQNSKLKRDNQELINGILPQYESSAYKSSTWDAYYDYNQEELDFEQ